MVSEALGDPRGCWGVGGLLGGIRGCQGCIEGLAWSVGTQGQKGYLWHQGTLRAPRGVGSC